MSLVPLSGIATLLSACVSTPPPRSGAAADQESPSNESADARALDLALAQATVVVSLGDAIARAPEPTDERRWPCFEQANRARWNLERDGSRVPTNTVYARVAQTEEGGIVREYLTFDAGGITWWFDGRKDEYSEFKAPSLLRVRATSLFLAAYDGRSAWVPLEPSGTLPLDRGLALGIELVDGRRRFW